MSKTYADLGAYLETPSIGSIAVVLVSGAARAIGNSGWELANTGSQDVRWAEWPSVGDAPTVSQLGTGNLRNGVLAAGARIVGDGTATRVYCVTASGTTGVAFRELYAGVRS